MKIFISQKSESKQERKGNGYTHKYINRPTGVVSVATAKR